MKITVDCRFIDSSGIGVYLRGCLPYFLSSGHSLVLLGDADKLGEYGRSAGTVDVLECRIKPFSVHELLFFPRRLLSVINKTGAYYSPCFSIPGGVRAPVYTTIHDVIFPDMPELVSKAGLAARMWFYRRAARRSKKIFSVSNFSASRIMHHLNPAVPVVVASGGIRHDFAAYRTGNVPKQNTVIFIGNIKKHKGLSFLIEAFYAARQAGLPHTLVIAGEKNSFRTNDKNIIALMNRLDDSVEFTGFVSSEELKQRLSSAALLVQPSLYEGFGFPPLEALVCGTNVLVSDIPVFREIYADFPVTFFRAGDAADLKEKLLDLLLNREPQPFFLSEELAGRYTFEKTAMTVLENIKSCRT